MRGRVIFKFFKPVINLLVFVLKKAPFSVRVFFYNAGIGLGGKIGIGYRYVFLKSLIKKCGDNVSIHKNVYLLGFSNITIGSNVSIHPMCYIEGEGGLDIGSDVSIAHAVTIMSTSHTYEEISIPFKDQGIVYKKVSIGNNVWIGCKATILYGVDIKERVIVGAASLVNRNIPTGVIAAGSPAKIVKYL